MGNGKKRKHGGGPNPAAAAADARPPTKPAARKAPDADANPLRAAQQRFLTSLPANARSHFFSPTHLTPEQRAEIWEAQADLGEELVNKHAWATPDERALRIFQHFGPIVEVGCGANAYWSKWMHTVGGVDVVAFDMSLEGGGKIDGGGNSKNKKKEKGKTQKDGSGLVVRQGGPEVLSQDEEIRESGRTLFLCYPDEEVPPEDGLGDDAPASMAASCLEHFTGSTIIHVGELYGDTLSMDQAPFGRSSSGEFQTRLAAEYHCILKMRLESNWLHVRDTLSVWKRSDTCCIAFQDEEDEEDVEEVEYKYIPPEEMLPTDAAAPCVAHLLSRSGGDTMGKGADGNEELQSRRTDDRKNEGNPKGGKKKKRKRDEKAEVGNDKKEAQVKVDVIAGNAW